MQDQYPEEEELVLCTVKNILGTTVFVDLDKYGKTGVIATSEIAPGRIRNIRDYVVPHKKIVCKVLRVDKAKGHIDLSLRRVSQKDTKEVIQHYEKEKVASTILGFVLKEKAAPAIEKIQKSYSSLFEFLQSAKEKPELLERLASSQEAKKILEIIKEKLKPRKIFVKAILDISTTSQQGVSIIKDALSLKDVKVIYLGAPKYQLIVENKNYKEANKKLEAAIEQVTKKIKAAGGEIKVEKS